MRESEDVSARRSASCSKRIVASSSRADCSSSTVFSRIWPARLYASAAHRVCRMLPLMFSASDSRICWIAVISRVLLGEQILPCSSCSGGRHGVCMPKVSSPAIEDAINSKGAVSSSRSIAMICCCRACTAKSVDVRLDSMPAILRSCRSMIADLSSVFWISSATVCDQRRASACKRSILCTNPSRRVCTTILLASASTKRLLAFATNGEGRLSLRVAPAKATAFDKSSNARRTLAEPLSC